MGRLDYSGNAEGLPRGRDGSPSHIQSLGAYSLNRLSYGILSGSGSPDLAVLCVPLA